MKKIILSLLSAVLLCMTLLLFTSCKGETVDFIVGDGVYHTSEIKKGTVTDMPSNPGGDDMYFLGWFTDDGIWDGAAVDGLKVYAGWLSLSKGDDGTYTVTGVSDRHLSVIAIPSEHNGNKIAGIGERAFYANSRLTEISIPASITSIENGAFSECPLLTAINVDTESETYKSVNGDLYSKDGTVLLQYAIGKKDTSVLLPEGVTTIAPYAFSRCTSLASITIPRSVVSVPDYAFYGCDELTEIKFADGSQLTAIGSSAFSNCISLKEITIPKSVTSIGEWAFYRCTALTTVSFERKSVIENIEEYAFALTSNLKTVYYDGSTEKWSLLLNENDTVKELAGLLCDYDGAGVFTVPDGAWTPTEEYSDITYGVWLTEDEYLSGIAPHKWYTTTELLTEHIGTTDANGTTYADDNFIPGYVHLYADLTNTSSQLVSGHMQKLKINLGGRTLTLSKGIRVGGNDASHPEASLTIANGTVNFIGGQIQPRRDSTFVIERTVFRCSVTNNDIFYGGSSDLIHFKNSELIVTSGATFMLTASTSSAGTERSTLFFEGTDIIYCDTPAKNSLFRIVKARSGITAWDIIFDADSSLRGEIESLITLKDTIYQGVIYEINDKQTVRFMEGFTILTDVGEYTTYLMVKIDPTSGNELTAESHDADDAFCEYFYSEQVSEGDAT